METSGETWIPQVGTIPEAIAWWAEATPEAPALLSVEGEALTYGEAWRRIDRVARTLAALGVERTDRVALALPDGTAAAIAGLATMRAAIGVPVNPGLPSAEAERVVAAVAPRLVIVARGASIPLRAAAAQAGVPVVEIDAAGSLLAPAAPDTMRGGRLTDPTPDDLTLILLTSGTTDRPRRVPVRHDALLATCSARVTIRALGRRDRGLSSAPAYFVLGLSRIAESLLGGGSVIVATPAALVRDPEAVRDLRPTWAWMSPALLEMVLEAASEHSAIAAWPLRVVRSGGAQVTADLITRAEALWRVPVLNGYGTTETLGYIAAEEHPETIPRKPGSVGLVRPGLELVIRDADGAPLPPGATGEITVRGPSVFPGYLDDPAATAAAFFPEGWYRTGDLGHLDAEGYLFVTGRAREMINRGGEKVAPSTVDAALRRHPGVVDAAAFALPDRRLGEEVAAAVVPRPGTALTARELRRWVARQLAPHEVPRRIWFVEMLPRTGSGKVQRLALTERYRSAADA
jgi:acyl-CoA synthetase (AMP-forming)/AMP-acid ligase II